MQDGADVDVWGWYWDIPSVTRAYMTATFAITALVTLDVVSPFTLYYNSSLIMQGQVWRLLTNFLYFGPLGINFLMHMYFAVQQCGWLERDFHGPGGTADFLFFLLLSASALLAAAPFVNINFFGSSLTLVIVYVWSKRHADVAMGLFGVIPFRGAWLPYVMVGFSLMFGQDIQGDLLGMAVGHVYFYFADVWPVFAASRGWAWRRPVSTPRVLYWVMGLLPAVDARDERLRADDERRQRRLAAEAGGGDAGGTSDAGRTDGDAGDTSGAGSWSESAMEEDAELAAALAAIAEMEARAEGPAQHMADTAQPTAETAQTAAKAAHQGADTAQQEADTAQPGADTAQPGADTAQPAAARAQPHVRPAIESDASLEPEAPPDAKSGPDPALAIEADMPTMSAAEIRRRRAARFGVADD